LALNGSIFSSGWSRLVPDKDDNDYYLESEGFLTYTNSTNGLSGDLPYRHSYLWLDINGAVEFAENYWISAMLRFQNYSLSYTLSENKYFHYNEPRKIMFFPLFLFRGTFSELFLINSDSKKTHEIEIKAGTLPEFTFSKGLLYSQFTANATQFSYNSDYLFMQYTQLGSGYYSGDDVIGLELYSPGKYFGLECLFEINTLLGSRAVPGVNFELEIFKGFLIFSEAVSGLIINRTQLELEPVDYLNTSKDLLEWEINNWYIFNHLNQKKFSKNINKNNLAYSAGFQYGFKSPSLFNLNAVFANEFRFYGKDHSLFYTYQQWAGFDFYKDITSDEKFNNQPHNYHVFAGEKMGIYLRQQFDLNPYSNLFLRLKNEFLIIQSVEKSSGYKKTITYGNDIFSLALFIKYNKNLEYGIQASNIFFKVYRYNPYYSEESEQSKALQDPLYLKATNGVLFDFYMHYFFDI